MRNLHVCVCEKVETTDSARCEESGNIPVQTAGMMAASMVGSSARVKKKGIWC